MHVQVLLVTEKNVILIPFSKRDLFIFIFTKTDDHFLDKIQTPQIIYYSFICLFYNHDNIPLKF